MHSFTPTAAGQIAAKAFEAKRARELALELRDAGESSALDAAVTAQHRAEVQLLQAGLRISR